jgi:hypothetical protein
VFDGENHENDIFNNHITPNVLEIGRIFSPEKLKKNININSTDKKSQWSCNFNQALKASPYLIRNPNKKIGKINFENQDSSDSKVNGNSRSSQSQSGSSSSDDHAGRSSSSNPDNSQMSFIKMANA